MKYLLYILGALLAVGSGVHLYWHILFGSLTSQIFASLACLGLVATLYFTCKVWYHTGAIDTLKELRTDLKKQLNKTKGG